MGAHMDVRHVLFPGYSSTIKAIAEIDPDPVELALEYEITLKVSLDDELEQ
jgi:hypothetical protein